MRWQFKDCYRGMWSEAGAGQESAETRRNGLRWSDAECRHLLAGYEIERLGVPFLAARHKRGATGIAIQLSRLLEDEKYKEALYLQLRQLEFAEHEANERPAAYQRLNADIIKAYADGAEIEYKVKDRWVRYGGTVGAGLGPIPILGDDRTQWRVRPKPQVLVMRLDPCAELPLMSLGGEGRPPNLSITFVGGELVRAEVLERGK